MLSSSNDDNNENHHDLSITEYLNEEKSLIYKHPLFPLFTYVFQSCDQLTKDPLNLIKLDDIDQRSSFEKKLKIFISKNEDLFKNNRVNNNSSRILDNIYIDAIQTLYIHLLELEKLKDLCQDFCQRYISCLKIKFDKNYSDDDCESIISENNELNEEDSMSNQEESCSKNFVKEEFNYKQIVSTNDFNFEDLNSKFKFNGQTRLSEIISNDSSSYSFQPIHSKRQKEKTNISQIKRQILPKSATSIMRSWLFQNIIHPYPTDDEKQVLSQQTKLSLLQINNWFINARRRIIQPMLEMSSSDLVMIKKRKRYHSALENENGQLYHRISTVKRHLPSSLDQ